MELNLKMTALSKNLRNDYRNKIGSTYLSRKSNRRTNKSNVHYASHMTQITLCKLSHSSTIKSKSLKQGNEEIGKGFSWLKMNYMLVK